MLAVGFLICVAAGLPGHLSTDSVIQLYEGRRSLYESFNPPVMSFMLGVLDRLLPGTSLFILGNMLLLFGSLLLVIRLRPRTSWLALPAAVVLVVLPQFVIYPGIVWKDVLFATTSVAGFIVLGLAVRALDIRRAHLPLLAVALCFFTVAALARQNGLLVAMLGCASLGATTWGHGRRLAVFRAVGTGIVVLIAMQATNAALAVVDRSENGSKIGIGLRVLQQYDIVGAVAEDREVDLSELNAPAELERRLRAEAGQVYSPERVDTLSEAPELMTGLGSLPAESISAQWRSLILSDTGTYLSQRWGAFRQVLFTPVITQCLPVHVGVDGPPEVLRGLGITADQDAQDRRLYAYTAKFFGTPLLSHAAFTVLALVVAAVLSLRREPTDLVIVGLQLSALAVAASYFVVSIACDYRYLYFMDVAAIVGLLYLAADPPPRALLVSRLRRLRARQSSEESATVG